MLGPDSAVLSPGWENTVFLPKKNNQSQISHSSLKPLQTARPQQLTREQLHAISPRRGRAGPQPAPLLHSDSPSAAPQGSFPSFSVLRPVQSGSCTPTPHPVGNPWFSTSSSCELKARVGPWGCQISTRWGWLARAEVRLCLAQLQLQPAQDAVPVSELGPRETGHP